jgi:hypothetical protein
MPTDEAPAATAARAYSICTSFPDGLKQSTNKSEFIIKRLIGAFELTQDAHLKVVNEKLYRSEAIVQSFTRISLTAISQGTLQRGSDDIHQYVRMAIKDQIFEIILHMSEKSCCHSS